MTNAIDIGTRVSLAGMDLKFAKRAVILLHGRGSSGQDIIRLADSFADSSAAFLAPSADWGSWYPQHFLAPIEENEPYLSQALDTIEQIVSQLEGLGISSHNIGIAGFSQGACLALEYVSRSERSFAFVAALSGALVGPLETKHDGHSFSGMPVLVACAEADGHIPLAHVKRSVEVFRQRGARVTEMVFPGNAHTLFVEELDWLKGVFDRLEVP